jgi:4-carboxymuconolactone decarboxylase
LFEKAGKVTLFIMRILLLLWYCGLVWAQTLPIEDIQLRGNRFKGLAYREMTAAQRAMLEHTVNSARAVTNATANGPFNVLLRSPEIGDLSQQLGNRIRFTSDLNGRLRELATLMAGRAWASQFEWYAHAGYGRNEGIAPSVIDAIAQHLTPDFKLMNEEEIMAWRVSDELLYERQISARLFEDALKILGERRLVSVVSLAAYYEYVSMVLNLDGYTLPPNALPEAQNLPQLLPAAALYRKPHAAAARGFASISPEQMTAAQRALPISGHGNDPALQRNPEFGLALETLGAAVNRDANLAEPVRRAALTAVLHQWKPGGPVASAKWPDAASAAAWKLSNELLSQRQVGEATFFEAREQLGERGIVNLIILLGYGNITCAQATLSGDDCTLESP